MERKRKKITQVSERAKKETLYIKMCLNKYYDRLSMCVKK